MRAKQQPGRKAAAISHRGYARNRRLEADELSGSVTESGIHASRQQRDLPEQTTQSFLQNEPIFLPQIERSQKLAAASHIVTSERWRLSQTRKRPLKLPCCDRRELV